MFSIIIPTRKRIRSLSRLLESFENTTKNLSSVEIILVVDSDDEESKSYENNNITIIKVIVEPGASMGTLNMSGYEACTGDYIMLLNDDVVVATKDWDKKILKVINSYRDGIVLIHVNDGIFRETLCTFPLLTRTFIEIAGGICPVEYERYRIDDHIYNVFNLLSIIGKQRIVYLPDICFEHKNYEQNMLGTKIYIPNEATHKSDTVIYEELFEKRKELANRLLNHINEFRHKHDVINKEYILNQENDSLSMRDPSHIRTIKENDILNSKNTRVTIGVVSANYKSNYATKCLNSIKRYTYNYELILIDNNGTGNFNHAREMNRLISMSTTDYLVLMDDDVFVEPGWLDGLLKSMSLNTGVVTPLHNDFNGILSYAGIAMDSDYSGNHEHIVKKPGSTVPIMTLCSALMLIDLNKCGHIQVDESYSKYFLDIDYGLRIWEAGFEVVCTPDTKITHVGGATLPYGSSRAYKLFDLQKKHYLKSWIDTKRFHSLETGVWNNISEIQEIVKRPIIGQTKLEKIVEGYKSYNIVKYKRYYGITEAYRALTVERLKGNQYIGLISGESIEEIKGKIDRKIYPAFLLHFKITIYAIKNNMNSLKFNIKYFIFNIKSIFNHASYRICEITNKITGHMIVIKKLVRIILISLNMIADYIDNKIYRIKQNISSNKPIKNHIESSLSVNNSIIGSDNTGNLIDECYRDHIMYRYEYRFYAIHEDKNKGWEYHKKNNDWVGISHTIPEMKLKIDSILDGYAGMSIALCYVSEATINKLTESKAITKDTIIYTTEELSKYIDGLDIKIKTLDELYRTVITVPETQNTINETPFADLKQIIIPSFINDTWSDTRLEQIAAKTGKPIYVINDDGLFSTYTGEDVHRVTYNKSYLISMMDVVPFSNEDRVLEIGCSDGLVCNMLKNLGMSEVVGIDLMETVGVAYPGRKISYEKMDAESIVYPDESFNLILSIATLEHIANPAKVFDEAVRVTKVGGYGYLQAGPLYCSPFGHHMFSYFQDYPWIHLRLSRDEILTYMKDQGIDKAIREDYGLDAKIYLNQMLNRSHLNGLLLEDYKLSKFRSRKDIKILKYNVSYEGKELLNKEILSEIPGADKKLLTEHGFEIVFKRLA